jgi:hypothetical protein
MVMRLWTWLVTLLSTPMGRVQFGMVICLWIIYWRRER